MDSSQPQEHSRNIGIIGLGAMGTLWASRLSKLHQTFALPKTSDSDPLIDRKLIHLDSSSEVLKIPIWNSDSPLLDIIIVCTKASATLDALISWQSSMSKNCQIVLIQNGMGQHDKVCQKFPTHPIFAASTTEGAFKQSSDVIVHAGSGQTIWGHIATPCFPDHVDLAININEISGIQISTDSIQQILLDKLAINAVINPLTVYHNCKNGELVKELAFHQNLVNLANEVEQFLLKKEKSLSFCLAEKATEVANLTGNNTSSMKQDVMAKRLTEIDYISGYLLELSNKSERNELLPLTSKYYQHVKSMDIN